MTEAAQPIDGREAEALEWATELFRECAVVLADKGSEILGKGLGANALIDLFDLDAQDDPAEADELMSAIVSALNEEGKADMLRYLAAALLKRGHRLPTALADFVAAFLCDPKQQQPPGRGRKATTLVIRDLLIGSAVGTVTETWGFYATRNEATERPCAASIISQAITRATGKELKESEVVKIWGEYQRRCIRANNLKQWFVGKN